MPLPAKRPPCFFNPAHGPSSQNVEWAPPGGVARDVPACPADAERVPLFAPRFEHSCLNRLQLLNTLQMVDLTDQAASLQYAGTLENPVAGRVPVH